MGDVHGRLAAAHELASLQRRVELVTTGLPTSELSSSGGVIWGNGKPAPPAHPRISLDLGPRGWARILVQTRTWKLQERSKLAESERLAAKAVFEDLSGLMDKRIYRTRSVVWALDRSQLDLRAESQVSERWAELREVVTEWNDRLHRNLALTLNYFGKEMHQYLENTIYEEFKRIHAALRDEYIHARLDPQSPQASISLTTDLDRLADFIYSFNAGMITHIQRGLVGRFNSQTPTGESSGRGILISAKRARREFPLWPGAFFAEGRTPGAVFKSDAVKAIQQILNHLPDSQGACEELTVDGTFGRRTTAAVMRFQEHRSLAVDGRVGRQTWEALMEGAGGCRVSIMGRQREVRRRDSR